ncbi:hypothetical protein D3C84_1079900 [compost metagenome]
MHALEDLREGFALLEIQPAVVTGARRSATPDALRVEVGNEIRVGSTRGPTGTH